MTGRGSRKQVAGDHWKGRLDMAQAFLFAAQHLLEEAREGQNCSPVSSNVALSAIAFCDAVTAKHAGVVNQKDHASAVRLLRDVMRQKLPDLQERRFRRILARKDEAQYGARRISIDDASILLEELLEFAAWCREQLE